MSLNGLIHEIISFQQLANSKGEYTKIRTSASGYKIKFFDKCQ